MPESGAFTALSDRDPGPTSALPGDTHRLTKAGRDRSSPVHVAITGAAGTIGEVVRDEFPADSRTLFTHNEHDDLDSEQLDVTDEAAFDAAIDDCDADVLIHLAWNAAPREGWNEGTEADDGDAGEAFFAGE